MYIHIDLATNNKWICTPEFGAIDVKIISRTFFLDCCNSTHKLSKLFNNCSNVNVRRKQFMIDWYNHNILVDELVLLYLLQLNDAHRSPASDFKCMNIEQWTQKRLYVWLMVVSYWSNYRHIAAGLTASDWLAIRSVGVSVARLLGEVDRLAKLYPWRFCNKFCTWKIFCYSYTFYSLSIQFFSLSILFFGVRKMKNWINKK